MRENIRFPKKGGTAKSSRFLVLSHDLFIMRVDGGFFLLMIFMLDPMNQNELLLERMKVCEHPIVYVNACTHGNERVGARILETVEGVLVKRGTVITNIANREAFTLNKRFIDQDLNRSFPGRPEGNYEERLASELSLLVNAADVVIDIHSTESGKHAAIIVTKLDVPTVDVLHFANPERVLVMSVTKNNALISSAKVGIAFEYGKDGERSTYRETLNGVRNILVGLGMIEGDLSRRQRKTELYEVASALERQPGFVLEQAIQNFKLVKKGEIVARNGRKMLMAPKDFYPVLFGESAYTEIFGFMGEEVRIDW